MFISQQTVEHRYQEATVEEKKAAKTKLQEFGEQLLADLMTCMDGFTNLFVEQARCARHEDDSPWCPVFPARDDEGDEAEYLMAGTSCQDWSSMGGRQNLGGNSVLPFSIELQIVKRT